MMFSTDTNCQTTKNNLLNFFANNNKSYPISSSALTSPLNNLSTKNKEITKEVINLVEENLFKLQCVIKGNGIRLSTRHEYLGKELIAFAIGTADLGLYYVYDSSQPPIIKNIPWFLSPNKTISALCFDSSGYWLLVASQDGSLHIIAAAGLVDSKRKPNQQEWKEGDYIKSFASLNSHYSRPSSLIWWKSMSNSFHTGIVGTEQGEILFIDLDTGQLIGLTRVDEHISRFHICQDSELNTVNLIITSKSKRQWFLVLEEPAKDFVYTLNNRSSAAPAEDNENSFSSTIKKWHNKSRLIGLKKVSFDNFSILKKKLTKCDSSGSSGTINSTNYSQCNGSDNLSNPLPINNPAFLISHCSDHEHNNDRYVHLSSNNILTIHKNNSALIPLCTYKLPDNSINVILRQHLFYVVDRLSSRLSIISRSLSQDKLNGNSQFNEESVIAQFSFEKRNEFINEVYIVNDMNKKFKENTFFHNEEIYTIPKLTKELKRKLTCVNSCVIVTNLGIYRVTLRCSLFSTFMDLIISRVELQKAKKLADTFGLNFRHLMEFAGDILLENCKFYHATNMFKKAKCQPFKIFTKLASVKCMSELLNYLEHCLEVPSTYKLSIAEIMPLSNLSIIVFTELSAKATTPKEQQIHKKFKNFLSTNMYYDKLGAVSIIGQAHLWSILHHLVIKGGLFAQVLDLLMKTLPLNFKNSHLNTNHELLVTISEPILIRGMIENFSIAKSHMSFVLANLSSLQIFVLQRLILLYDPTNPVLRPLISQCKTRKRSDSRNSLTNSLDSIDVQEEMANLAEKIVEMFLLILLVLIQKTKPVLNHNPDLIRMFPLTEIKKNCREATINVQYKRRFLSSGYSHVALLRNKIIYNWESTITSSLGTVSGSVFETPQEIIIFRRMGIEVISVSSGFRHTMALTKNGLYAWGGNQYGQVGLENLAQCPSPQLISSLADEIIIDAVAGQYHSVALTSDGRVFTWGWGIHGQLGHGNAENMYTPTLVSSLLGISIKCITAGYAHTMILSSESIVYVFGGNYGGQLGAVDSKRYQIPKAVELLPEKVSLIATKYFHNLAVTSTNKLYIWGINPREQKLQKMKVIYSESMEKSQNCLSPSSSADKEPEPLEKNCAEAKNLSNGFVEQNGFAQNDTNQISNGLLHSCKDKFNKFIENHFSDLNQEPKSVDKMLEEEQLKKLNRSYKVPTLVDTSLVKGEIVQISTGLNHSALITKYGTVYTWGKNFNGQLGNNNREEVLRPTPLIYKPVLSFSQVPAESAGRKSKKNENGLVRNGICSNHRMNIEKESCVNNDSDIDNKGAEKDENNEDNDDEYIYNNSNEADDIFFEADDGEFNNFNHNNDSNEKDIDDFENCINSNDSVMNAVEISCGNNYTIAAQQGGAIFAWGEIGISRMKSSTLVQARKPISKKIWTSVRDTSVTLIPIQVPNIPAPVISYQTFDTIPLVGFTPTLQLGNEIPGERVLHFILEQFSGFYDVHKIMKKCIALGNHQACAKLALLEHNFPESLMYQLKSLMSANVEKESSNVTNIEKESSNVTNIEKESSNVTNVEKESNNVTNVEKEISNVTNITECREEISVDLKGKKIQPKNFQDKTSVRLINDEDKIIEDFVQTTGMQSMIKSSTFDNLNDNSLLFNEQVEKDLFNSLEESVNKSRLKMSTSKSMDALSSIENELHTFNCQGGSEEMYGQADDDNNVSELSNSNKFDDEIASDNSERLKSEDDFFLIDKEYSVDDFKSSADCVKKAMTIVEFYINETENFSHAIVRDVLLTAINAWLELELPLRYLEKVFLKNLNKVFYPLGLILFCENNSNEDVNNDDAKRNQTKVINLLSTKLTLNVCSALLQHINQGKSVPEYVELLSQLIAKCFGPPLTGFPGSSENHTTEQMLEGMKSTLSSTQSDPRPFIHIKDPDKVAQFLEIEDSMVFTCGHYFPISSSEFVPRLETELLVSHLPCTAEVLGNAFQQKGQLETLCPQCVPRALQTVVNNSTNR